MPMPYCNHPLQRAMKRGLLKWTPGLITCEEFEQFVVDYIDGTLADNKLKVFKLHLKICPECRDYIQHYQQTIELANRAGDVQLVKDAGDPPADLVAAILDAQRKNIN